jgi:5-methylcytosine-specific restriction endonuclease McrA
MSLTFLLMHIHNVGTAMSKNRHSTLVKSRTHAFHLQAGLCFYCNQPMWTSNLKAFCSKYQISSRSAQHLKCTAEHVIARKDGGSNQRDNIVAACLHCNRTRHKAKFALSAERYRAKVVRRMDQKKWHPVRVC